MALGTLIGGEQANTRSVSFGAMKVPRHKSRAGQHASLTHIGYARNSLIALAGTGGDEITRR
jgi:hypothetical protein